MAETRINLKHLLENLRDSYPFTLEEAIVTELIANCLDSRATRIDLTLSEEDRYPAFIRNQKQSFNFHVALAVALVLSNHLLDERSPQQFVSEFLGLWGKARGERVPLLKQLPLSKQAH